MTESSQLVPFPEAWATTRQALHRYLAAISVVPRAHAEPHPHWWHIGLTVQPNGLVTTPLRLPDGGSLTLGVDPARHAAWLDAPTSHLEFPLDAPTTGSEFGDRIVAEAVALGLDDTFDRARYASDEATEYDLGAAVAGWHNLTAVHGVLERHRARIDGETSPVHVWAHHFDMSFEWFGTRMAMGEGGSPAPAQLNLGFDPGETPYFYSSPWPFDDRLLGEPLPEGAAWHTAGWKGSMLPFDAVLGDAGWAERVLEYAAAVHRLARPTLMA